MSEAWSERNQQFLVACVHEIKLLLRNHAAQGRGQPPEAAEPAVFPQISGSAPSAIDTVCSLFGLSTFERSVLVLCAGVELDAEVAQLCVEAQGNLHCSYPTFGLALAALPTAHWSALSPASSLRRFRLIELCGGSSVPVTARPLRIEERVLHYLTGVSYFERQLQGLLRPVRDKALLVDSHQHVVERILFAWKNANGQLPRVQLLGHDEPSKLVVAQRACAELGVDLWCLPADLAPLKPDEVEGFVQLWSREAALLGAGLYVSAEDAEAATQKSVARLIDGLLGPVFLGTRERWPSLYNSTVSIEVKKPEKMEQRRLWELYVGEASSQLSSAISKLVSQFDLNASTIEAACREALLAAKEGVDLPGALWEASCTVTRPRVSELAQQIPPKARMGDLVLPVREKQLLREISIHVAQRHKVYEEWGFEAVSSRGLGITALFSGASGTGKTMAAEVLANELRLDLFRIDLSTVVSKYIGETEKNLRRVFDAVEEGGGILFFDEADALFGKRTEVRDSHDRYANIEVNYLLQRMENYRGLAILATNMKAALDPAFVRRLRFIVNFPFPDENSRAEIWERIFPAATPTEGVDVKRLARLNITGGHIRNIALYASFLAADEGVAVNMSHLRRAAQVEYAKLERPLTQTEMGDW